MSKLMFLLEIISFLDNRNMIVKKSVKLGGRSFSRLHQQTIDINYYQLAFDINYL